jgi:hypothetical protein
MRNSDQHGVILSRGQARFAQEHKTSQAMPAAAGQREVFLYHDDPWATYRWLVDDAGHAVDLVTFRKSPRSAA